VPLADTNDGANASDMVRMRHNRPDLVRNIQFPYGDDAMRKPKVGCLMRPS